MEYRFSAFFLLVLAAFGDCFLPFWIPIAGFTIHHKKQTEVEFKKFLKSYFELDFGITDYFIPASILKARETIKDANANVDSTGGNPGGDGKPNIIEKNFGPAHFDDEFFQDGQDHLSILRSEMIDFLKVGNVEMARVWLGRQLHAIQDFYSHTNWVESGRKELSDVIGKPNRAAYPRSTRDTCTEYCQDRAGMNAVARTAYDVGLQCHRSCFLGDVDNSDLLLGFLCTGACPSMDELCDIVAPTSPCGILGPEHACEHNIIEMEQITSGYYYVPGVESSFKPSPRKCVHGGLNDDRAKGIEGINKDSRIEEYAPHWFLHDEAARLGMMATQQYFQDLTTDFGTVTVGNRTLPQPALTRRQMELLFGVGSGPLAFVIDTTGSMGDVIASVQSTVAEIINLVKGKEYEPVSYVLMGFNDPVGANIISTTSADDFLIRLNSFFAAGGADCPEPGISAVSLALDSVASYSNVFFFTDASASDPGSLGGAIKKAQDKKTQVTVFQFPSGCSDSSAYYSLAASTGGQHFLLSERRATDTLVHIAINQILPDVVNIYTDIPETSEVTPILRRRAVTTQDILVDSTMKSLTISAAGTATITVTRPDGSVVSASDPSVSFTSATDFTYITITNPAVGVWQVSRSDTTSTSIQVTAQGFLNFNKFDFVALQGDKHPGMFPINGTIVAGKAYNVSADIEADLPDITFQFRDRTTGAALQDLNLTLLQGHPDMPPEHLWIGEATVPCGLFQVYATGKDPTGAAFQRLYPQVFGTAANCTKIPTPNTTTIIPGTGSASPYPSSDVGKWNTTSAPYAASDHTPTATGYPIHTSYPQGIPLTETVVYISTATICPYTTTLSPCPTDPAKPSCIISTSSTSITAYTSTHVLVPISNPPASSYVSSILVPSILPCSFDKATASSEGSTSAVVESGSVYPTASGGDSSYGPYVSPTYSLGPGANGTGSEAPVPEYTGKGVRMGDRMWSWGVCGAAFLGMAVLGYL